MFRLESTAMPEGKPREVSLPLIVALGDTLPALPAG
jgi:hypothetical protein